MRAALLLLWLLGSAAAWAAGVGTVTHVRGTLSVQHADGKVGILSQNSEVNAGDLLTAQRDSYAQVSFTDGSSITLRPNSQMKVEDYHFVKDKPKEDSLFMRLIKGGLRSVTGLVGKRGNQDAYQIKTSAATVGIRGSSGDTLECSKGCEGVTPTSGTVAPGVYHTTYTGLYIIRNEAGVQLVGPGQFVYVKDSKTPPVILPADPGFNLKNPPFPVSVGGGPEGGGGGFSGGGSAVLGGPLGGGDGTDYGQVCLVR